MHFFWVDLKVRVGSRDTDLANHNYSRKQKHTTKRDASPSFQMRMVAIMSGYPIYNHAMTYSSCLHLLGALTHTTYKCTNTLVLKLSVCPTYILWPGSLRSYEVS